MNLRIFITAGILVLMAAGILACSRTIAAPSHPVEKVISNERLIK